MKLYFAWANENEAFNPDIHALTDGEILSLSLTEREGDFPLASIEISNPYIVSVQPFQKKWCYISCDLGEGIEVLFKGKICSVPHYRHGQTVVLNFTAQPSDWEERLQILHQSLKVSRFWDPLFVSEENQDDPLESLEARSELFFWCRKTGSVKLSDLFWGSHKIDFSENHFYDGLKIHMGELPLTALHVSISVEWVQKYRGETDLSPLLRSHFRDGLINTLTGEDLKKKWWKSGEKIGKSGYWISKSTLKEVIPHPTGELNLYLPLSDPIWVSPEDPAHGKDKPSQPQQTQLKRSWFKVNLVLGWIYRQKRCEKIQFTLNHTLQLPEIYGQRSRKLNLKLQNVTLADEIDVWRPEWNYSKGFRCLCENQIYVCVRKHRSVANFEEDKHHWIRAGNKPRASFSSQQGRFFATDRGQKAIEYAIEIARAHLASSARAMEISIMGPIENFMGLTCDHSVKIKDIRLPGGQIWGKVKALKLFMNGSMGKQWGEVTLGVSVGTGEPIKKSAEISYSSYGIDYAELPYHADMLRGDSPSGIEYHLPQNQENQTRWIQPQSLTARDLIQEIAITYSASQQNQHLLRTQYPLSHNIEAVLKEIPTTIHMRLLDLRPLGTLKEYMQMDIPHPWSSPKQIDLANI